ncbi:hypothetical protein MRX96_058435 [Rhipicephalus microplus]
MPYRKAEKMHDWKRRLRKWLERCCVARRGLLRAAGTSVIACSSSLEARYLTVTRNINDLDDSPRSGPFDCRFPCAAAMFPCSPRVALSQPVRQLAAQTTRVSKLGSGGPLLFPSASSSSRERL